MKLPKNISELKMINKNLLKQKKKLCFSFGKFKGCSLIKNLDEFRTTSKKSIYSVLCEECATQYHIDRNETRVFFNGIRYFKYDCKDADLLRFIENILWVRKFFGRGIFSLDEKNFYRKKIKIGEKIYKLK